MSEEFNNFEDVGEFEEVEESIEVDVTEISVNDEDIDEMIEKLNELKTTKDKVEIDLDEENQLVLVYEKEEENE